MSDNPLTFLRQTPEALLKQKQKKEKEVPTWYLKMMAEANAEAERIVRASVDPPQLVKYQRDPVLFGEEMLGHRYIPEIEEMMYSVRDNPVTIARSANSTGKSFGSAAIALWFYLTFGDAEVYLTAAPPLENLKRILWGEVSTIVERHPELFVGHIKRDLSIYRDKNQKSRICCVTIPTTGSAHERESKFNGKHAPHLLFVVDEGDAVPEEVYKGIESCTSGGMSRLLIMFNPHAKVGPVYAKERDRTAHVIEISALNHPNVVAGKDIIPGAVTRDKTVQRINKWTRPLAPDEKPDESCFEVPSFLVGETTVAEDGSFYLPLQAGWRKVPDENPEFWYMVLGQYPAQSEWQLINRTWVNAAQARWQTYVALHGEVPPVGVRPVLGLDVAEYGVDSSVGCLRYNDFVDRLQFWRSLDPDFISGEAVDLYLKKNCEIANVDGTGLGSGVAPGMMRKAYAKHGANAEVRAISVKMAEKPTIKTEQGEFDIMRSQLWWTCREWLRTNPNAMLPPDPYLAEELCLPTYKKNLKGKIIVTTSEEMRKLLKRSPDRANGVILTFYPKALPKVINLAAEANALHNSPQYLSGNHHENS